MPDSTRGDLTNWYNAAADRLNEGRHDPGDPELVSALNRAVGELGALVLAVERAQARKTIARAQAEIWRAEERLQRD